TATARGGTASTAATSACRQGLRRDTREGENARESNGAQNHSFHPRSSSKEPAAHKVCAELHRHKCRSDGMETYNNSGRIITTTLSWQEIDASILEITVYAFLERSQRWRSGM